MSIVRVGGDNTALAP
jgi:hypothetical protein